MKLYFSDFTNATSINGKKLRNWIYINREINSELPAVIRCLDVGEKLELVIDESGYCSDYPYRNNSDKLKYYIDTIDCGEEHFINFDTITEFKIIFNSPVHYGKYLFPEISKKSKIPFGCEIKLNIIEQYLSSIQNQKHIEIYNDKIVEEIIPLEVYSYRERNIGYYNF